MTKKYFVVLIAVVIVIIAVSLFFANKKNENSQVQTVKIGVTLPLSGNLAYIGEQIANGLQMGADEINSQLDDKKIELVIDDNKGDIKEAVNSVNKFINVDQSEIIFSAFTHITGAVKDVAISNEKTLFYMSSLPDYAREYKYAYRDYYDAEDSGRVVASAVKNKGYQKVAVVTEISDAAESFINSFVDEANKLGIEVEQSERVPAEETDLKTTILKLKLNEVDALVTSTWRQEHILMQQLKELGYIDVPTFHLVAPFLPISNTPEMKKLFEENKAISSWYGITEVVDEARQVEFKKKYIERYGYEPTPDAAFAYDDIHLLAEAIKSCNYNAHDKDCLSEKILNTKLDGVGGHLEFDENGVSKRHVPLIQVIDGQWQEIE